MVVSEGQKSAAASEASLELFIKVINDTSPVVLIKHSPPYAVGFMLRSSVLGKKYMWTRSVTERDSADDVWCGLLQGNDKMSAQKCI